jgi:hypothetical protein
LPAQKVNRRWLRRPDAPAGFSLSVSNGTPSGGVSNDGVNNFITITSPTGNLFFRLQHP